MHSSTKTPCHPASEIYEREITRKHIEIIAVDTSGMKETGFGSMETCRHIFQLLNTKFDKVEFRVVCSKVDLDSIIERKPDAVVLCSNHIFDEKTEAKIWLSEYLSSHDISCTGSCGEAMIFDSDKAKAKSRVIESGLPSAAYFLAHPGSWTNENRLPIPLPLFVKPLSAANGNGIDEYSVVTNFSEYQNKVAEITRDFHSQALVEKILPGREYTVALLEDPRTGVRVISPIEIVVPANMKGNRTLGFAEKTSNCEALWKVPEPLNAAISAMAGKVFSALGARDFGRIDFKLDADGSPNFIEANFSPGMTPESSYFPLAFEINFGMSYSEVLLQMVEAALNRNRSLSPS